MTGVKTLGKYLPGEPVVGYRSQVRGLGVRQETFAMAPADPSGTPLSDLNVEARLALAQN